MLKKIRDYFRRLKVVEQEILMLKAKIKVLEDFMQTAKEYQTKKNLEVDSKKKWLNSYPDETSKVKKEA